MKRLPQGNGSNWLTPAWILGPFAALLVFVGILSWLKERPFLPVDNYGGVSYPRLPAVSTAETELWSGQSFTGFMPTL